MFYDILKAVPAVILCYLLWRYVTNKIERDRHLVKAQEHYNCGRLDRGNVWVHLKTGRPYTVLCLTNTGTSKAGWEVNVVYTNDFEQIYSRPFSEFCHKFTHVSEGQPSECFNTTLLVTQMINNTKLRLPKAGEIWVESSVRSAPSSEMVAQGHVAKVFPLRVRIDLVLGIGQAHPVVVFTVNEDYQTAMLLSQFIFVYHKEVEANDTASASV